MNKNCPNCNNKMTLGYASIHGTFVGFLFFGFSYQNLYFRAEGEKEIKVLDSGCTSTALKCDKCDTVVLIPNFTDTDELFDEEDFTTQTRDVIVEIITICSSKELQDSIASSNPGINLWEDIFQNWKENYKPDMKDFSDSFSMKELVSLKRFNNEVDNCLKLYQGKDFLNFQSSSEYEKLAFAAERTINDLDIG